MGLVVHVDARIILGITAGMVLCACCLLWLWHKTGTLSHYALLLLHSVVYAGCCGAGWILAGRVQSTAISSVPANVEIPLVVRGKIRSIQSKLAQPTDVALQAYEQEQTSFVPTPDTIRRFIVDGEVISAMYGMPIHEARIVVHLFSDLKVRGSGTSSEVPVFSAGIGDSVLLRGVGMLPSQIQYMRGNKITMLIEDVSQYDYAQSMQAQWIMSVHSSRCTVLPHIPQWGWTVLIDKIADQIRIVREDFISSAMKIFVMQDSSFAMASSVMIAMLTGYDEDVPPNIRTHFQRAGTIHIMSVSGFHIGLVAAMIHLVLVRIQNRRWRSFLLTIAIMSYSILSGWSVSAERACMMAVLVIGIAYTDRKIILLNVFAVTIILIACLHPTSMLTMGFQLSVMSVGMLIIGMPIIQHNCRRIRSTLLRQILVLVWASWLAGTAAFLVLLVRDQSYSLWTIFTNILLVPCSTLALLWGAIAFCIGGLGQCLGGVILPGVQWIALAGLAILDIVLHIQSIIAQNNSAIVRGTSAWIVFCVQCIGLFYALRSLSHRQMLSRMIIAYLWLIIVILYAVNTHQEHEQYLLRPKLSATIFNGDSFSILVLADHVIDPNRYRRWNDTALVSFRYPPPRADIVLARHIRQQVQQSNKPSYIFVDGESSLRTVALISSPCTRAVVVPYRENNFMQFVLVDKLRAQGIPVLKTTSVMARLRSVLAKEKF